MKLNELRLKGFRNLAETVYTPGEGVNVIYGENAHCWRPSGCSAACAAFAARRIRS